jgi:hypothetical protein
MLVAFKPDISTLQIVEVDVSNSQKMDNPPSRVIRGHTAEQIPVTSLLEHRNINVFVLTEPLGIVCSSKLVALTHVRQIQLIFTPRKRQEAL